MQPQSRRIVYCRCRHSDVVPASTRDAVLRGLCNADASFEAVGDLCELAAGKDPRVAAWAETDDLRLAGCHPRAMRLLLREGGLDEAETSLTLADMRSQPPEEVLALLLGETNEGRVDE